MFSILRPIEQRRVSDMCEPPPLPRFNGTSTPPISFRQERSISPLAGQTFPSPFNTRNAPRKVRGLSDFCLLPPKFGYHRREDGRLARNKTGTRREVFLEALGWGDYSGREKKKKKGKRDTLVFCGTGNSFRSARLTRVRLRRLGRKKKKEVVGICTMQWFEENEGIFFVYED